MSTASIVLSAAALVLIAAPLLVSVTGRRAVMGAATDERETSIEWRVTIVSTLLYVLAFNLVFFIQELALVVSKALTPGLYPTLFHNNHRWLGAAPIAHLLQGSGVVAILAIGAGFALLAHRTADAQVRLFSSWMSYHGFFLALPQFAIGAFNPASDVGMAMRYLHWSDPTRIAAALFALLAMPVVAWLLARPLLSVAVEPPMHARAKSRAMFRIATLPALAGVLLIIPFRVPREWVEVVLPPLLASYAGASWLQALASRVTAPPAAARRRPFSIAAPAAALLALLVYFQFVLRPGIRFF